MKKFLKVIYQTIVGSGFVLFLVIISIIFSSFTYYNHQINSNSHQQIEMFLEEEIVYFIARGEEEITIEVKFKEEKETPFLIAYATNYFDLYKKRVQLIEYNQNIIIIVSKNKEITVSYI